MEDGGSTVEGEGQKARILRVSNHLLEIVLVAPPRPEPELTVEIHTCDPQSVRVRTEARVAVGSSSVRGRVRVTRGLGLG